MLFIGKIILKIFKHNFYEELRYWCTSGGRDRKQSVPQIRKKNHCFACQPTHVGYIGDYATRSASQGRIQDFHWGGRKRLRAQTHITCAKSEVPYGRGPGPGGGGGGTQMLFGTGVRGWSPPNPYPSLRGHFGGKGYPLLGVWRKRVPIIRDF